MEYIMLRRILVLTMLLLSLALASVCAAAEQLRVALIEGQSTVEISCEDEFQAQSAAGEKQTLPKGKYFVHVADGRLVLDDAHSFGGAVTFTPLAGKALPQVNQRSYKGSLRVLAQGEKLLVVNQLELETYLASVLPAKTMVVWPDEAVRRRLLRRAAMLFIKSSTAAVLMTSKRWIRS